MIEKLLSKIANKIADYYIDSKTFEDSIRSKWLISYEDKINNFLIKKVSEKWWYYEQMLDRVFSSGMQSYSNLLYICNSMHNNIKSEIIEELSKQKIEDKA